MFTPPIKLIDHKGRAALAIATFPDEVIVERDQFEAVAGLIPEMDRSQVMQAALDDLKWADETPCEHCTGQRPVVTIIRDAPACAACAEARQRESARVREVFKAAGLGGDCQ